MKKLVLYVLNDQWCEWEGAYAADVIHSYSEDYEIMPLSMDGTPRKGMSGRKPCGF